jgi:cyclophilin family peptidyl-prolyl cis-trans isomerase
VTNGFYDDASFFRVIRGFVVQFGMHAKPEIQRAWQSANIRDDAVKQSNKRGYLVFASAGPNTRTTQVFINLGNNAQLDAQGFSPFGNIVEGMDVVEKFYSGYGDPPRGPDQGRITAQGRAYLDKNFPNLDRIISATLAVQDEAPTAAKLGTVYISNQSSADKLQLNADGTFSLQEGGQSFSGTYLVRGRTLKLHIDQLKKEVNIEIQEDSLIVNGNEIWVQPKQ